MSAKDQKHGTIPVEVELRNLSAKYDQHPVLDSVDLDIMRGESLAIIGPSGGGKSTLLRCIALLHPIESGTIAFQGAKIADSGSSLVDEDQLRRKIGLVHQEWNLWANKTVLANLIEAPRHVLRMTTNEAKELARKWLDRMELIGFETRYPGQLSGGQKQRVAIARALMMNPDMLMCDEITSALDIDSTHKLLRVMESLRDGQRTFIFVSHHLEFVRRATNRVAVLVDGGIIEVGDSNHVISSPRDEQTASFLETVREAS